ncbi:hypothetical protein DPMN_022014 [Dreissena polymorpha]|uniref:Uncharacterized protein n=1 Tax=Dreissena polymorpha TaxID=45954 RepID=A0A9D4NN57_DREPO|nr:hypothetical protein DPMN_022014 [Dreissena polymorpha]
MYHEGSGQAKTLSLRIDPCSSIHPSSSSKIYLKIALKSTLTNRAIVSSMDSSHISRNTLCKFCFSFGIKNRRKHIYIATVVTILTPPVAASKLRAQRQSATQPVAALQLGAQRQSATQPVAAVVTPTQPVAASKLGAQRQLATQPVAASKLGAQRQSATQPVAAVVTKLTPQHSQLQQLLPYDPSQN